MGFYAAMKHRPHSVKQMLAYCRQNTTGHKWRDINQWWPSRPDPEVKPMEKAVNADEYNKDANAQDNDSDDDNDESDKDEDDKKEQPQKEEASQKDDEEKDDDVVEQQHEEPGNDK